jgi:hypothetical protein
MKRPRGCPGADGLAAGRDGEVEFAGEKVTVQVAEQIRAEIEVELSWATAPSPAAGTAYPAGEPQ